MSFSEWIAQADKKELDLMYQYLLNGFEAKRKVIKSTAHEMSEQLGCQMYDELERVRLWLDKMEANR